jgi:hypothetical protein
VVPEAKDGPTWDFSLELEASGILSDGAAGSYVSVTGTRDDVA